MTFLKHILAHLLLGVCLVSCSSGIKDGNQLTQDDLKYFKKLGVLDEGETVLLFGSQLDHKTSGNLISDKRLASYWIEDREEKSTINFAWYHDIDTMVTKDLTTALTYASYIEVFRSNGSSFKVYVDDTPQKTQAFFDVALSEWKKKR